MTDIHHDVVVVGDGPAGLAHAAAHAAAGRSVALVGRARLQPVGTFELLSGDLAPVLQVTGILPQVQERAPRCAGAVFRWGMPEFIQQSGNRGRWAGGWMIDRHWFDPALREIVLARFPQIEVVGGTATAIHREEAWQVDVLGPEQRRLQVTGSALSLVTGRSDRLHGSAGLRPQRRHPMVAITCHLPGGLTDLGPRLLVDAATDGWWYAMGDGRSSTIGYVTDTDLLASGPDRIQHTWARAVLTADWLPSGLAEAPLVARRAAISECPPSDDPGAAVPIGDAALSADPLSGHGLLVGLRGALHAAANLPGYRTWILEQQQRHRQQERDLYSQVSGEGQGTSTFWTRRHGAADATAPPAVQTSGPGSAAAS